MMVPAAHVVYCAFVVGALTSYIIYLRSRLARVQQYNRDMHDELNKR